MSFTGKIYWVNVDLVDLFSINIDEEQVKVKKLDIRVENLTCPRIYNLRFELDLLKRRI